MTGAAAGTEIAGIELRAERLTKRFGLRTIFADLTFTLVPGDLLAITGCNGSGKSTLLKILANVTERSGGKVGLWRNGTAIDEEKSAAHIGFVAPYLQLYGEFTAWEHVELIQQMRGLPFDPARATEFFTRFGLADRHGDRLETFSSGMMQRAKFVCALIHHPPILLLDEPMTNLDAHGIETMRRIVREEGPGRITVIATNEQEDVELCTKRLSVER